MAETKTFKNPEKIAVYTAISGRRYYTVSTDNSRAYYMDDWDMEVTFTEKPRFKVADRVNLATITNNYHCGTVVHVCETMAWVVWDNNQRAVRMYDFKALRHV